VSLPDVSLNVLAERAVASPRWAWILGMRVILRADGYGLRLSTPADLTWITEHPALPDLTDAATIGSIGMLVRRTHKNGFLVAVPCAEGGWQIHDRHGPYAVPTHATTEIGAWIALLEAS